MPGSAKPYLDPRAPLVLDTRELGRRAGSLRRARFTVPAPPALGTALVGVPVGAELELDLRLEAVMEGILVSGQARAPLTGECSRCLDPLNATAEVELQQLFVYPDLHADQSEDAEDGLGQLIDDRLDLEPVVRDAVVLALPISPRCREDCPGLCPTCGERLAELPPDHSHPVADSRWAALAELSNDSAPDSNARHPETGSA
jgi:uncharacterized protein